MADLGRRLVAESLGAALLVATIVGSGVMAERLTEDGALALLADSLPTGAILVVLITLLGPISGAHLNPAVSLVFALRRILPAGEAGLYALVQCVGAVAGTVLAHAMFGLPLLQASQHIRSGAGLGLAEGVATFGLVIVILGGLRSSPQVVPWLVGLYITAAYWFTASTSFANPAVTIARAMTDTFAGIRMIDAPTFVAAQLAGAILASIFAGWLWSPRRQGGRSGRR